MRTRCFLLKCRHGYREQDSPSTKIDVAVNASQPVMIVRDHGSDEEWAAKCEEQQRRLVTDAAVPQTTAARLLESKSAADLSIPAPARLPAPIYAPAWKPPALF